MMVGLTFGIFPGGSTLTVRLKSTGKSFVHVNKGFNENIFSKVTRSIDLKKEKRGLS